MEYFKYRNISKVQQLANKQRLASLGKDEKNTEPIRKCAKGLLEKAYGYKWKYLNF